VEITPRRRRRSRLAPRRPRLWRQAVRWPSFTSRSRDKLGTQTLFEGPDGPEATRIRAGKPYLRIAAVAAIAAGILAVGILGPHPSPNAASASATVAPSPGSTAIARVPEPTSAAAGPSGTPEDGPRQLQAITGLRQVAQVPGETLTWLPLQITSRSFGIIGRRLFYVVAGNRLESSVLDSTADPQTLVTVSSCQAINQVAAAGNSLLYVVTFPAGPSATIGGCDGFGQITWELWLMDLPTGHTQKVASGIRQTPGIGVAEFPIHIALTASSYAFDRPDDIADSGGPETVEVHAIDGRALWTATAGGHVADVVLGGDRLAVITQQPWPDLGTETLWLADSGQPRLVEIAQGVGSASLTSDGAFLSWDTLLQVGLSLQSVTPDIGIEDTRSGVVTFLPQPVTADLQVSSDPRVSVTAHGGVATWFATAPDGTVYPAFSWLAAAPGAGAAPGAEAGAASWRSGFLESAQQPVWMAVDGSSLIWVAEGRDGWSAIAFEADLDNL
jgi:hypothetical protein